MKLNKAGADYLDVGAKRAIPTGSVVGIFDLDTAAKSATTKRFLRIAEERGEIMNISYALPKSFLLQEDGVGETVILSPLGTRALAGRGKP